MFEIFIRKKRASLELSINAIIIVVLAMTLLGLGLTFIRGQIKKIQETTITVQEQVKEQILDDLRRGDKRLSFPSTRISVDSSDKKDLAIGVKNTGDSDLNFNIEIHKKDATSSAGGFVNQDPLTNEDGTFFWDNSDQTLEPGESRVIGILHQAETTKNTYLYKLVIRNLNDDSEYDSKSFFVTVQ